MDERLAAVEADDTLLEPQVLLLLEVGGIVGVRRLIVDRGGEPQVLLLLEVGGIVEVRRLIVDRGGGRYMQEGMIERADAL